MFDYILEVVKPQLIVFTGLYFAVLLAMIADLFAGYRKAKKDGFLRSSKGLRRTVKKIAEYYNLMFVVSIIDCVYMTAVFQGNFSLPQMPICTFLATIFLCIIELKSIYEKKSEKERADMETVAKFIAKIAKDKDTKQVIELISEIVDGK